MYFDKRGVNSTAPRVKPCAGQAPANAWMCQATQNEKQTIYEKTKLRQFVKRWWQL